MDSAASIATYVERQSRRGLLFQAIVLISLIGYLDYVTGYEVTCFPFYAVPIFLLVWQGNTKGAIVTSVLSAIVWCAADVASGHVYSREWLRAWDTVVRLFFFLLIVISGTMLRQRGDANRAQIELLRRTQRLEKEIVNVSEREQARIGRDLHDGLCQYLASVGFVAESLRNELTLKAPDCAGSAGEICDLLEGAVLRAREVARGLSPVDRDEGGLESALEELAVSTGRMVGISCVFLGQMSEIPIANDQAVDLFRIAQEALNNAVRHSAARSIVIALETCGGELSLRISDDGVGILPRRMDQGGMGMSIMRYRARRIGGLLEIAENVPSGTVVTCTVRNAVTL